MDYYTNRERKNVGNVVNNGNNNVLRLEIVKLSERYSGGFEQKVKRKGSRGKITCRNPSSFPPHTGKKGLMSNGNGFPFNLRSVGSS